MTYRERKERMDYLLDRIEKGWCYDLENMATKFSCSKRTVIRMLNDLRDEGYNIQYCKAKNKYILKKGD